MTDIELVKDMNLIMQYLQGMRDTQEKDDLERYYHICKKKLEEIYRDKKDMIKEKKSELKAERKAAKKEAKKAAKKEEKRDRKSD